MGFSPSTAPAQRPTDAQLTRDMIGIGMVFSGRARRNADIENTLVFASELGMEHDDLRVLAVLTTWLEVHARYVNADRLIRKVKAHSSSRVQAYWSAVGAWQSRDRRFARLSKQYEGETVDLLPTGTDFQLRRKGADPRFVNCALRVAEGTLRDRAADVAPPSRIASKHRGYRNRVHMGPTWRADAWTALEEEPTLRPADLARRVGCSFATAWGVVRDWEVLNPTSRG